MDRSEAEKLLRGGPDGVNEWNRRREAGEQIPNLNRADLARAHLNLANLKDAELRRADFHSTELNNTDLRGANLVLADLGNADLSEATLTNANLRMVKLSEADLSEANLRKADLSEANLRKADLNHADLSAAKLTNANLQDAVFACATLNAADFRDARIVGTTFSEGTDLSVALGLDDCDFRGPCTISHDTMVASKGRISESFLQGCGLQRWEILGARLYDPALSAAEVTDLQYEIFRMRTTGPFFIGGVFISYSHADSPFVDRMYEAFTEDGVSTWLDRHDLVAGPLQKQVDRAIRLNDVVLLVLSEHSIDSDWVEHELTVARKKEKEQHRDTLCPVALDDTWKAKVLGDSVDVHWEHLKNKNVLDFSQWEDDQVFKREFAKLLKGLKIYYPPVSSPEDLLPPNPTDS